MFIAGRRKGIPLCDLCATEMRLRKTLEDTPSKVFCVLRLIEVSGASETQPVSPVTAARKDTVGFYTVICFICFNAFATGGNAIITRVIAASSAK